MRQVKRIVLVDDHIVLREALRDVLQRESDLDVVGEAGDQQTALVLVDELEPDVVVLDITLGDQSGVDLAREVTKRSGATGIVGFSMHIDRRNVSDMLEAGAGAYVSKTASKAELLEAIRAVADGQQYLCREAAAVVAGVMQRQGSGSQELTARELDVLRRLAEGKRSARIAHELDISVSTVEVHRRNIMNKLGLHSSVELTRYAIREGIVSA